VLSDKKTPTINFKGDADKKKLAKGLEEVLLPLFRQNLSKSKYFLHGIVNFRMKPPASNR